MTSKEVAADILRRCYVDHRKEPDTVFKGLDVEIEEAIDAALKKQRERFARIVTDQICTGQCGHSDDYENGRTDVIDAVRAAVEDMP